MRKLTLSLALVVLLPAPGIRAGGDLELIETMASMQYFLHKLDLSIRNDNHDLAGLYVHELEEVLERTMAVESYDGRPVGKLARGMLLPAVEDLEAALESGEGRHRALDGLVEACNACHRATQFEFIRVQRTDANPFMQSFAPPDPD